ncbi:MAG: isochorismatase family cysteine hydrolase [Acidobacteriota bacterium]|nr:isochorismatase family cysteine hydrolase [Acidobacteriota bacterium]
MKKLYVTPETIESRSRDFLREYSGLQPARPPGFDFLRSALLVLDMQRVFMDPSSHAYIPSAPAVIPRIRALAEAYEIRNRPAIFTRHVNTPEDAGRMADWWRNRIAPDNPLSALIPEFHRPSDRVILKSRYDAFFRTPLEEMLRGGGVDQVVICGVMTHLCCETTARSAFMRGFDVFFTVDGTATYTEAFHRASLLNLAHGFAVLTLSETILEAARGDEG